MLLLLTQLCGSCFFQGEATIHYNKLQADPKQGKSLDIGISTMRQILSVSLDSYLLFNCIYIQYCYGMNCILTLSQLFLFSGVA